jgi:hypothetical protein
LFYSSFFISSSGIFSVAVIVVVVVVVVVVVTAAAVLVLLFTCSFCIYTFQPLNLHCFFSLSQYLTKLMHKICFTISFISGLYMFRAHLPIIRRSKLHYTASCITTPIDVMIPEAV